MIGTLNNLGYYPSLSSINVRYIMENVFGITGKINEYNIEYGFLKDEAFISFTRGGKEYGRFKFYKEKI